MTFFCNEWHCPKCHKIWEECKCREKKEGDE